MVIRYKWGLCMKRFVVSLLEVLSWLVIGVSLLAGAGFGYQSGGVIGLLLGLATAFISSVIFFGVLFVLLEINEGVRALVQAQRAGVLPSAMPPQMSSGPLSAPRAAPSGPAFSVGQRVHHDHFGQGTVTAIDGTTYTVDFGGKRHPMDARYLHPT